MSTQESKNFFYGRAFPENVSRLAVELYCFRTGRTVQEGGLGRYGHFRNAVDLLWGLKNNQVKVFQWTPWAEKMAIEACRQQYLGVVGCASSGKTDFFAVWGIVNFLAAPRDTMVLVTSTSLKDSRKRIWGSIRDYWTSVKGLPGKLVDSLGLIRHVDHEGKMGSDRCGISLIAGERKREKEAVGKLIGYKNKRVILIADELPELSLALMEAAVSNLSNNPSFQMIGIGNPDSKSDPLGVFCRPKLGWDSITPESHEWETELGFCIRFDAERSPNVLAGRSIFPWMIDQRKLDRAKQDLGEDSLAYWRMFRGFWCPTGMYEGIYAEADFGIADAYSHVRAWKEPPQRAAALDASFVGDGDKCILRFGLVGVSMDLPDRKTLDVREVVEIREEVSNTSEPRTHQIVRKVIAECKKRGIEPFHFASDNTGAGGPFNDVLAAEWSPDFLRVNFGGAPSRRIVDAVNKIRASDRYKNKVSELWYSGKDLLRGGQLKGISVDLSKEMCSRRLSTKRGTDTGLSLLVEPKGVMKARTGESPDNADALFILIELARERLGLESNTRLEVSARTQTKWKGFAKKANTIFSRGANLPPTSTPKFHGFHSLR
jgi:hypothetical protein